MSAQESHCVTLNDAYAALKDGSISWVAVKSQSSEQDP
jgi:hypothetical protein